MTKAGIIWREIGRPTGSLAIEKDAFGRPISLRLIDGGLSFRPHDRSDSGVSKGEIP
ncbi:MAG: hypothetical protein IH594_06935 [Bacteroidales bacterium]|nr:hypothetical protein [Bacteroidales bacterium]